MFADKEDPAFVADAIGAGVCSYNLSGVSTRDMKAIVASAVALFRPLQQCRDGAGGGAGPARGAPDPGARQGGC